MGRRRRFSWRRPKISLLSWPLAILITVTSCAYHYVWWYVTWRTVLLYVPDLPVLFFLPFCVSIGIIVAYRRAGKAGHVPRVVAIAVTVVGLVILVTSFLLTSVYALYGSYPGISDTVTTRIGNTTYHATMIRDDGGRPEYYLYACESTGRLCNERPLCVSEGFPNPTPALAFDSQTSELVVVVDGHEVYRQDGVRAWYPEGRGGCIDQIKGVPVKYPP